MRFAIAIANRQRARRVNGAALARLARAVLKAERVSQAEISIALVDDQTMRDINSRFLGHNFSTDVLSFPLDDAPQRRKRGRMARRGLRTQRSRQKRLSGEVVICTQTAARAAHECGTTFEREVALYLVHGLLHLCGYDDQTPAQRKAMRRREAELLPDQGGPARYTGAP
jgi:probable rRNA maturation factor